MVTLIEPDAPVPTTASKVVEDSTLKEAAAVPPRLTAVVPVRLVPVIVTVAPVAALAGVNELMVGAGIKINPVSAAVPPAVVTLNEPDAPAPTTAVIRVDDNPLNDATDVPPRLTAVGAVR